MNSESQAKTSNENGNPQFFLALALLAFCCGVYLRYQFICVDNRAADPQNIIGDAGWYVHEAVNSFKPDFVPTLYDTLFPPGAPMYFSVLLKLDPSLTLLHLTQWFLASLLPLILGYTAYCLYNRRVALLVLGFSSLYFPLWEFYGYFLSEGPFIFSMFLSFLLCVKSLQAKRSDASIGFGFLAGIFLGVSAACKSCSLATALLMGFCLALLWLKHRFRLWPTVLPAVIGLALILTPVAIRATRFNEGKFLLIANDASRTFLLGHQGKVGLTWWIDDKRNFRMNFVNPSTTQRNYVEQKTYPFGPYDNAANYQAGFDWIKKNPREALELSIEHVLDMFIFVLPWPGYFRDYVIWTKIFNNVFIGLILVPACFHLARSARSMLRRELTAAGDLIVFASAISIYIIAFLFLGEGRYRISYDGFMLLLSARAFFNGEAKPIFASQEKHTS